MPNIEIKQIESTPEDVRNLKKIENLSDLVEYAYYKNQLNQLEIKHFQKDGKDYYVFEIKNKKLFYIE